jgi:L-iditol 2-dehydrogenase/galactitol-1-phosphate 5-dehydrogenase
MKAAIITGPMQVACVDKPVPQIGDDEVLLKVIQMGICGSDIERASRGQAKHVGLTIGHELVGRVVKVGSACTTVNEQDRVIPVPLLPCFHCTTCEKGDYNLCSHYSFIGSRRDGGGAEYLALPERNAVVVPDGVTDDEATLLEPLTVGMHAVMKMQKGFGSRVLVLGGGVIGQLTAQVAMQAGAQSVALTDMVESKLDRAKRNGIPYVFNSAKAEDVEVIKEYLAGGEHSVVFETSGSSVGKVNAVLFSAPRGEVIYVGGTVKDIVFPPDDYSKILRKELVLKGSWMNYSAPFPGYEWINGLKLLEDKKINTEGLITHRYVFKDVACAFDRLFNNEGDPIKVVLHP